MEMPDQLAFFIWKQKVAHARLSAQLVGEREAQQRRPC